MRPTLFDQGSAPAPVFEGGRHSVQPRPTQRTQKTKSETTLDRVALLKHVRRNKRLRLARSPLCLRHRREQLQRGVKRHYSIASRLQEAREGPSQARPSRRRRHPRLAMLHTKQRNRNRPCSAMKTMFSAEDRPPHTWTREGEGEGGRGGVEGRGRAVEPIWVGKWRVLTLIVRECSDEDKEASKQQSKSQQTWGSHCVFSHGRFCWVCAFANGRIFITYQR